MAQEVRPVVWQLEGCWFDPTLGVSKCPWARHLPPNCSGRAGLYLAWQPIAIGVCEWVNCKALWIKALYKCWPFTISRSLRLPISPAPNMLSRRAKAPSPWHALLLWDNQLYLLHLWLVIMLWLIGVLYMRHSLKQAHRYRSMCVCV